MAEQKKQFQPVKKYITRVLHFSGCPAHWFITFFHNLETGVRKEVS
jgi:hypothetical protein